jgi:hypothetical protein
MMLGPGARALRALRFDTSAAPPRSPDPPPGLGKASPGFLSIEGI